MGEAKIFFVAKRLTFADPQSGRHNCSGKWRCAGTSRWTCCANRAEEEASRGSAPELRGCSRKESAEFGNLFVILSFWLDFLWNFKFCAIFIYIFSETRLPSLHLENFRLLPGWISGTPRRGLHWWKISIPSVFLPHRQGKRRISPKTRRKGRPLQNSSGKGVETGWGRADGRIPDEKVAEKSGENSRGKKNWHFGMFTEK